MQSAADSAQTELHYMCIRAESDCHTKEARTAPPQK